MTKRQLILAILLNIFVIPGSGHAFVKRKARGAIFMAAVVVLMVIFVVHFNSIVWEQLQTNKPVGLDLARMFSFATALTRDILTDNDLLIRVYVFLFGVCYIAGVADLFWIYYSHDSFKP